MRSALCRSSICALFTCSGWLHTHRGKGCCVACTVAVPYSQCAPVSGHCTCTGKGCAAHLLYCAAHVLYYAAHVLYCAALVVYCAAHVVYCAAHVLCFAVLHMYSVGLYCTCRILLFLNEQSIDKVQGWQGAQCCSVQLSAVGGLEGVRGLGK